VIPETDAERLLAVERASLPVVDCGRVVSASSRTCPSYSCQVGASLLGVMTSSGRLAFIEAPIKIDTEFIAQAREMGRPEARFRFSGPCIQAACPQWTGERCAVADMVVEAEDSQAVLASPESPLPACAIRGSCRWYAQRGESACRVCPLVVADAGGTATYRSTIGLRGCEKPLEEEVASAGDHRHD